MTNDLTLEQINEIFGEEGSEIFDEMTQVLIDHGITGYAVTDVPLEPTKPGIEKLCCTLGPPPRCWIC